jgi:metal-dependent amidase/aminoacylase/carboxypeptidase family protein
MTVSVRYPVTANVSRTCIEHLLKASKQVVPEDKTQACEPTMAAAEFLEQRPGVFYFLGSRKEPPVEGEATRPHHKSNFDIHESFLEVGAAIWVQLILDKVG